MSVKVDNAAPATPITVGTNPSDVVVSGNHAYVANAGSNTVSVIDTGTKQVVATIPVGTGPNSLVATPQPNRVYVANSAYNGDNTVSVIDTTTNTVAATIPIPHPQPTYLLDEGGVQRAEMVVTVIVATRPPPVAAGAMEDTDTVTPRAAEPVPNVDTPSPCGR